RIRYRSQGTDRVTNHFRQEHRSVHRPLDVERAEVTRDIIPDVVVIEIVKERRRSRHLKNLGAQIRVSDLTRDRVSSVHGILEHNIRIPRLELKLSNRLEELPRIHLGLGDLRVSNQVLVLLSDVDISKRLAVLSLDIVRREQVHILILSGEIERDIRDHNTKRQRLDPHLLVCVLTLGVQELHDIRVVRVQVHSTGTLTGTELVSVRERVLEDLHHRDNTRGRSGHVLDRRTRLPQVRQEQSNPSSSLRQLTRLV